MSIPQCLDLIVHREEQRKDNGVDELICLLGRLLPFTQILTELSSVKKIVNQR